MSLSQLTADRIPHPTHPDRFRYIHNFHRYISRLPSIPPIAPPTVTAAESAYYVPGFQAPWDPNTEVDIYLLHNAMLTTGSRTRIGNGALYFEDPTYATDPAISPDHPYDEPPAARPLLALPPIPADESNHSAEPATDPTIVSSLVAAQPAVINLRLPPTAPRAPSLAQLQTELAARDPVPRIEYRPNHDNALGRAIDEAFARFELHYTDRSTGARQTTAPLAPPPEYRQHALDKSPRESTAAHDTDVRMAEEQEGPEAGELRYPTDEEVDQLQADSEQPSPLHTPLTPSPVVSPLGSPRELTPEESSDDPPTVVILRQPYNLRPRPRPTTHPSQQYARPRAYIVCF